jgi:NADH-quinone oxidoreductase subunit I
MGNPIKTLSSAFESIYIAIKNMFYPRITLKYPMQRMTIPEGYRGQHYLYMDRCTGCSICAIVCPPRAITMVRREPTPKNKGGKFPLVNYNYCIYCGFCVHYCPFDAIHETNVHDLASYTREALIHPPEFLARVKDDPSILYTYTEELKESENRWKATYVDTVVEEKGVAYITTKEKSPFKVTEGVMGLKSWEKK